MRAALFLLALSCIGAKARCGGEEDEGPPTPVCLRTIADGSAEPDGGAVEEGATCPAGWIVTCPADKPKRYCIYDEGAAEGKVRCIGDPLDWAMPRVFATCEPE